MMILIYVSALLHGSQFQNTARRGMKNKISLVSNVNRQIILALPKREKMATYREIARVNNLDISCGVEKAVERVIFALDAKHIKYYAPDATIGVIKGFIERGLL